MDLAEKSKIKEIMFEAFELREKLMKILSESGIEFGYIDIIEINPFYNQISTRSSLVIEDSYRVPAKIYTPLGYIRIRGCSVHKKDNIIKMEELLLENNIEFYKDKIIGVFGEYGGWRKVAGKDVIFKKHKDYLSYEEAEKLFAEIYNEYKQEKQIKS